LQSVTHYIANDSLAPDQRLGFIALTKFASLWVTQAPGTTPVAGTTAVTTSPVDGFEKFLYANAVGLCFQVPLMASFDYSDAGSYQVRLLSFSSSHSY
jgi:exportin-T